MPEKLIDRQWIDIVQPLAPAGNDLLVWVLIISFIVLAGLLYYFLWFRHPRQQLRRQVYLLYKNAESASNRKLLLARLEHALCQYHGIASLAQRTTLQLSWQTSLDTLTHYRYQKTQPTLPQTVDLLQHCLRLLRTKPSSDAE